ncbi:uncharacterized protein LOC118191295 isoform X2 [Stegodyphus dumicola]|uniref:uncharacterized protein LOC118191295 isoform X2 n=1 Tax=Stegodyphus dumicola TaxID=202533 RepID=UPI0015AF19A6|nr:uncharacterized protein LOC118191295 isoform X2 [Stegodyphus dumicola]
MLSKVCVFNNKIFIPNFVGHDIFIIAHTYVESTESRPAAKFYETAKIKLPLRDPVLKKDVYLDVTDSYDVGLKCMIIAVIDFTNKWSLFVYFDFPTSNLFRVQCLDWPSKTILLPNINFFFTHGPTCLMLHENLLELFLLSHKLKYCFNLKSIFSANFKNLKLLQIVGLGKVGRKLPLDVLLIILSYNVGGYQLIQIISLGLNSQKKDSSVTCRKLATSFFFPKCYESALRTVKVFNIQIPERSSVTNFSEINWTKNHAVVCTESECLIFTKGILKYCCNISLPFPEILYLKAELRSLATENVNLILSSGKQSVYFLTDKKKNNLQISKVWTGIKIALIGDILKKGVVQVLLLKNSSFSDWQDGCILTDISSFIPMDIGDQSSIPDECLKATISGLQKKIQDGNLLIAEREFEISQKIAATFDALYKLHDSTLIDKNLDQRCVNSFQESLVDIILHKDENSNEQSKIPLQNEALVKLNRHWMKLINHHLMMCWTFSNESERTICHPFLKIFIEAQSVQCVQKLFVHDSSTVSFDDRSEKEVNSKTNFTIIVNLINIPNFTERNIKSYAVLSWYVGSSSELNNEILLPEEEKQLIQNQLSLAINLSTDIFNCVQQKGKKSYQCGLHNLVIAK